MSQDVPSNDVCGSDGAGQRIIVCPVCDTHCEYTRLNSSCIYAKLTYVFDNASTILFAAVMSVWATLFLEGWKRYHAQLAYKWNVFDFEAEEVNKICSIDQLPFSFRKSCGQNSNTSVNNFV
jgi:hypothetical protein